MKRESLVSLMLLSLVAFLAPKTLLADQVVKPLIAGDGNGSGLEVGSVTIDHDGNSSMTVTYQIHPGVHWRISETHLAVVAAGADGSADWGKALNKKGNARPGKYTYGEAHNLVESVTVDVDMSGINSDYANVAAHAVVVDLTSGEFDMGAFVDSLPLMTEYYVLYGPAAHSYFKAGIVTGSDVLNNTDCTDFASCAKAWCADETIPISQNTMYNANVFALTDDLTNVVPNPQNADNVQYLINADMVGEESANGFGAFTSGDVQKAIWTLLGEGWQTIGLGAWDPERVAQLLSLASQGDGFVPTCDMVNATLGVILQPVDELGNVIAQSVLIEVPMPACNFSDDETAWGGNSWANVENNETRFFTDGWARYITVSLTN